MSTNSLSISYPKRDAHEGNTLCHRVVTVFAERSPGVSK